MSPYVILGTAGTILAAGIWGGYQFGAARYLDGFHEGIKSQQKVSDLEMRRVLAESRASYEQTQREASARVQQIESRQQAEIESARVEFAQRDAQRNADADRLRERVRVAERARAASRVPDRGGAVSEAAADPAGVDRSVTYWVLPPGSGSVDVWGGRLIGLAQQADGINAQLSICTRYAHAVTFVGPPTPEGTK